MADETKGMKVVQVNWFAAYREATGIAAEPVETLAGTTADLYDEMIRRHPGLSTLSRALVAINDEMANWETLLADGDRVLFFPPVAGG